MVTAATVIVCVLLAWFGLFRTGLGGLLFPVVYVLACAAAVCAVPRAEVAIPAMQPPVVATVAVVAASLLTGRATSTLTFLLGVLAPLAELFWWILLATAAAVALAVLRHRPDLRRRLPLGRHR